MRKKGFTLVELLAVLAILAIVIALVATAVIKTLNNSKQKAYDLQVLNIEAAARQYVTDNKNDIIELKSVNGVYEILLKDLSDAGYIETPIKNPLTNEYFDENEVVIVVTRESPSKYTYTVYGSVEEIPEVPFSCPISTLVDSRDGKTYNVVQIGNQCWLRENLAYTLSGCLANAWNESSPYNACMTYVTALYPQPFGVEVHYQWDAAMNGSSSEAAQGLCPTGSYIPTHDDYKELEMELGMTQVQADATGWRGTNQGAQIIDNFFAIGTNTSGFNGLIPGIRQGSDGSIGSVTVLGSWWTSTTSDANSWRRYIANSSTQIGSNNTGRATGLNVRCILN